jgi:hypothetical protein
VKGVIVKEHSAINEVRDREQTTAVNNRLLVAFYSVSQHPGNPRQCWLNIIVFGKAPPKESKRHGDILTRTHISCLDSGAEEKMSRSFH